MLLAGAEAGGAAAPVLAFDALKRLGAAVVALFDSVGFEVVVGKLKGDFGVSADCDVLGNIDSPPDLLSELGVVFCTPRLGNKDFGVSLLDCCASDVAGVADEFVGFRLGRLLNRPAVGCASGLLPKMFEPVLFDAADANMLVAGCELEVFASELDG